MNRILNLLIMFFILLAIGVNTGLADNGDDGSVDTAVKEGFKRIQEAKEKNRKDKKEDEENTQGKTYSNVESETKVPDQAAEGTKTLKKNRVAREFPLYDAKGKRDPFKPFIKTVEEIKPTVKEILPPIKKYPLNEFRLVGIISVSGEPQGMVVDPEGNTYSLGVGDEIGNEEGEITEVRQSGLMVQEKKRYENLYGEVKIEVKESVLAFREE